MSLDDLLLKIKNLKKQDKLIVQSHGVFDIIHPGIIQHLHEAKKRGDILIVTVIRDIHVRRGPGRPVFPEKLRVENVAALEMVDFVCVVDDEIPFECVKMITPDFFAKGQGYKERDERIHQKIFEEERELYFGKSQIIETKGFTFSSSQIINNFLDIYPEETKNFLHKFSKEYSFNTILEAVHSLSRLKTLLLGDGIIDEYHYTTPMGKSAKAQLVVNKYLTHEVFVGGAFAIANHLAGICKQVTLVTLLGQQDSREDYIRQNLKPNIHAQFFYREDGPTILKKRYVDGYNHQKLFEINYLNDQYIHSECENKVLDYIVQEIPKYDLLLISDFGHGFITRKMIQVFRKASKILAVNTQTNAANTGFNMITRYQNPHFVCLDETEARLSVQDKFEDIKVVAANLFKMLGAETMIVTIGKKGSIGIDSQMGIHHTPIFSSRVVDTVGAGDAVFSFTAPCFSLKMPLDLITFVGNAVGAIAVQIVGNKKPVEKYELLEFIQTILR
jgi:bifunctional ADP-heptose synthase (sugar kinase/adenylyltransferase)